MAEVTYVHNMNIAGFNRRVNRFISELADSVSASGSLMTGYDQTRLASYLDALDVYVSHVVDQPQLDLPESHPMKYELDAPRVISENDVENESVMDLIRMLELARIETINGQSARLGAGLLSFDEQRLTSIVSRCRKFLTDYIQTTTPLDYPETSPMRAMPAPGRGGV